MLLSKCMLLHFLQLYTSFSATYSNQLFTPYKMAITSPSYLLSYFSVLITLISLVRGSPPPLRKGVTLQLIHRFSPSLPFHKTDNLENFLTRNSKQPREGAEVDLITPSPDHLFFVNVSIGNPPVPQYLAMDTGSRATWVVGDSRDKKLKYSPETSSTHYYFPCGSSTRYIHSQDTLALGDVADVEGHTTAFFSDGSHYQLSLECLSFGDKKLDIDPKVFAYKGDAGSGVIIDTGAVLSYLTDSAYYQLFIEVQDLLISRGFQLRAADPFDKCFHGSLEKLERSDFPILSFNFADGASLKLDENDLFFESLANESICMTVRKSSSRSAKMRNLTVIGLTAMQDYVVGFDLDNLRLSMNTSL